MAAQPLVSIFVLSYNNAKYIVETLDSIKAQTYPNIELVIIDDCSTDNSLEVINKWLENYDKPYKVVIHEKNKGICAACNSAVANVSGDYVSGIASDDVMLPEKTRIQLEALMNGGPKVGAVYSDAYLMKDDSSPMYGLFIQRYRNDFADLPSGDLYPILLEGNFIPGMATMIRRSVYDVVGTYDENLKYEDWDFWLRLAQKFEFVQSDYVSVKYRVRGNSLMFTLVNKDWNYNNIQILAKHLDAPGVKAKLKTLANNAYLQLDKRGIQEFRTQNIDPRHSMAMSLLRAFKVPRFIGVRILRKLN